MKVYTVQYQEKCDYDFSVAIINHGCFKDKADAIDALKVAAEEIKEKYADEIEKYSDEEDYPDEDDGALCIEEDDNIFYMSFGYQEWHESHTVWIDEWEVK